MKNKLSSKRNESKQAASTSKKTKKKKIAHNILDWQIDEDFKMCPRKCLPGHIGEPRGNNEENVFKKHSNPNATKSQYDAYLLIEQTLAKSRILAEAQPKCCGC